MICARGGRVTGGQTELIDWGTAEDAALAAQLLYAEPCGTGCQGHHVRVWTAAGRLHVRSVQKPPPLTLRQQWRRAGYSFGSVLEEPRRWTRPSILNRPLDERPEMNPETRRRQDLAIEQAAGRTIEPTPGGLAGRAVAEHDAALAALATGDPGDVWAAMGHDAAAKALTDAALCE